MSALANKMILQFAGLAFDAATGGVQATTPNGFAHKLGVMQAIKYKTVTCKAWNRSDAEITVVIKEGANALATIPLLAGAAGSVDVDVAGISGAALLTAEVTVDTIGTGTGSAEIFMDIEQPIIVSGC